MEDWEALSVSREKREVKGLRHGEVVVKHAETDVATRDRIERDKKDRPHLYWPKGLAKPTTFTRRRPAMPCPKCERAQTDNGSRAVVCDRGVSEVSGKAYLTCKACRHEFSMALG